MIEIVEYKPTWAAEFLEIGSKICDALGSDALAIHHIGSTGVSNLAAKDVIGTQITVAKLEENILKPKLEQAGFVWRDGIIHDHCPLGMGLPDTELEKFFCDWKSGGIRRANIHIQVEGRFNQRYALPCRVVLGRTDQNVFSQLWYVKQMRVTTRNHQRQEWWLEVWVTCQ